MILTCVVFSLGLGLGFSFDMPKTSFKVYDVEKACSAAASEGVPVIYMKSYLNKTPT